MASKLIHRGFIQEEPEDIIELYKRELERLKVERRALLKKMIMEILNEDSPFTIDV